MTCAHCGQEHSEEFLDPTSSEMVATILVRKALSGEITTTAASSIATWCNIPIRTFAVVMAREHERIRTEAQ
jgi:hypothetical protein